MSALRCTAKLLKAMRAPPVANRAPATNKLGEWTANLVRVSRIQLVIAVSEPTRFGVVIDAAPYAAIPFRGSRRRLYRPERNAEGVTMAKGVLPESASKSRSPVMRHAAFPAAARCRNGRSNRSRHAGTFGGGEGMRTLNA